MGIMELIITLFKFGELPLEETVVLFKVLKILTERSTDNFKFFL
jgi:hypothetical protein